MFRCLLIGLLLCRFCGAPLYAQEDPSAEVEALVERSEFYLAHDLDSAAYFGRQALRRARQLPDPYWAGEASECMLNYFLEVNQGDSASGYTERALAAYRASDRPEAEINALFVEAESARQAGLDGRTMEIGLQLVDLAQARKDDDALASAYWMISSAFYFQERFTESVEYGERTLDIMRREAPDELFIGRLSSQANTFRLADDSTNALRLYREVEAILQEGDYPGAQANHALNYGIYQLEDSLVDQAEIILLAGLEAAERVGDGETKALIIGNLGRVYRAQKKYRLAVKYLLWELDLVAAADDPYLTFDFQDELAGSYASLGVFDSAYLYMRSANESYRDWTGDDYEKQIAQLQTEFETAEKDAEIAWQKNRFWWVGVVLLLALLAGGYFLVLSSRLRRRNAENEQLVAEKETLIGEIHHRVKNNLQVISSLLQLQRRTLEDAGALGALRESQSRVEAMGLIHQKLYQGAEMTTVAMPDYLVDLGETLLDAYRLDERVEVDYAVAPVNLDVDTAIPLGLIINELVTNSLKYAFPDGRRGQLSIALAREPDGRLLLTVADNGGGEEAAPQLKSSTSFGGNLVELLTKKLKGELTVTTENGYRTELRFREAAKSY